MKRVMLFFVPFFCPALFYEQPIPHRSAATRMLSGAGKP